MSGHLLGELERKETESQKWRDRKRTQVKEPREVRPGVLEGAVHVCGRKAPEYSHPPPLLLDPSLLPHAAPPSPPAGTVTQRQGFPLGQPALVFEFDYRSTNQAGIPKWEA